jgi:hypothetical protein
MSITHPECVFAALGTCMQFACAILSSVTCPALHYFSTLSHKWYDFLKKILIIKLLSETFYILRRNE